MVFRRTKEDWSCTAVMPFRWSARTPDFGSRCDEMVVLGNLGLPDVSWNAIRCRGRKVRKGGGGRVVDCWLSLSGGVQTISIESLGTRSRRNWTTGTVSAG